MAALFTTPNRNDKTSGAHFVEPDVCRRTLLAHGSWRRVTRRIVCGLACALTVSSLLMPSVSLAAEWVDVGGVRHEAAAGPAGDAAGTWSWDGADDMKLNGYNGGAIEAAGKLNVSYEGDNIVTNGDATDPVAVDFIAYVLSKDGQAIATDNGYIGEDGADFTSAQPEGKIVVGGSSSVSPLMEKLIEAYKTVNPNAELELQTTDSTTGVSGALEGTYTIGMASRELKDSEVEGGAKATVLALDGIAVVVNPVNTTDDLTVDQIKGIYTGELTTWADVQ